MLRNTKQTPENKYSDAVNRFSVAIWDHINEEGKLDIWSASPDIIVTRKQLESEGLCVTLINRSQMQAREEVPVFQAEARTLTPEQFILAANVQFEGGV